MYNKQHVMLKDLPAGTVVVRTGGLVVGGAAVVLGAIVVPGAVVPVTPAVVVGCAVVIGVVVRGGLTVVPAKQIDNFIRTAAWLLDICLFTQFKP